MHIKYIFGIHVFCKLDKERVISRKNAPKKEKQVKLPFSDFCISIER